MYKILDYQTIPFEIKEKFFEFCFHCSLENLPAAKNMWEDDWYNKPHTLPYILEIEKRFSNDKGAFFILVDSAENIVGCSGIYRSSFDDQIFIAGVRTWISRLHRHASINRDYFLVVQKKWALDNHAKIVALSFNEYNKNLIEIFKRKRIGEKNDRINTREPKHLFYSNFNEVAFPVIIQNVKQWIIYEKLSDYDIDWNVIRSI